MRLTSARALFLAASLTLTACAEKPSEAPTRPTFTLLESSGWADAEIRAVASMPVDAGLVVVKLDGQRLPIRVTVDTVAIRLPRGVAQGTLTLSYGSLPALDEPITIADFQDSYDGPSVRGYVLPVTGGSTPVVLATGESSLVRIDLRPTPGMIAYPASMHATQCMAAPGPTYQANVYVLKGWRADAAAPGGGTCVWRTWQLGASPAALDSNASTGTAYAASVLAPGAWLWASLFGGGTAYTTGPWSGTVTQMRSVRISPNGDVATFTHGDECCGGHSPVFDAATGLQRYSITALTRNWAATFSSTGDTLYVAGRDTIVAAVLRIVALDASVGTVLQAVTVPDSLAGDSRFNGVDDVLADPSRPYLYLFAEPDLTVIDRRTLHVVTQLHGVEPASAHAGWARLVLSSSEGLLYATEAPDPWQPAAPIPVYRFRLPE